MADSHADEFGRTNGSGSSLSCVARPLALALLAALVAGCGARVERTEVANEALGRPVSLLGGDGDPSVVTDGRLGTEGTTPDRGAVTLLDVHSAVIVDLGASRPIGAFLLQASAADVYFVEASDDGSAWRVAWRVEPLDPAAVLRTRKTVLPRPVSARAIRVRSTTGTAASVSEIQAYTAEPAAWPRLDTSAPGSQLPLWPALTRERLAALFQALASLFLLVVGWGVLARRSAIGPPAGPLPWRMLSRDERARRGALGALALVSLVAWPNLLNFHYYGFVHKWDVFHYYMGAKYLPELGYTRLYACTATVDAEDGLDLSGRLMRDLRDNRLVPAASLLERSAECRSAFPPQRWQAFQHDTRFFRTAMGTESWLAVRTDHGFNGTPAWAVMAGPLARLGRASWPHLVFLALLDVVLILLAFALIARAFGFEAASISVGYWALNTLSQWGWTGGGFLRWDWVFWLVAGVAALKAGRPGIAGFALAYSTLLRVFPVLAMVGLALKALAEAVSTGRVGPLRRYARFAAGAAAAAAFFLTSSALQTGRTRIWSEFADNSAKHLSTETVNLVGLEVFLTYQPEARVKLMADPLLLDRHAAWKDHLAAVGRDMRVAGWAVAAGFVLLLTLAVRRSPDWVAAVLGLGLMPMLLKPSGYYYSALIVCATLWPIVPGAGFALASFTWATTLIPGLWPESDSQFAWLSLAAVAFVTGLTAAFAWHGRALSAEPRGPAGEA